MALLLPIEPQLQKTWGFKALVFHYREREALSTSLGSKFQETQVICPKGSLGTSFLSHSHGADPGPETGPVSEGLCFCTESGYRLATAGRGHGKEAAVSPHRKLRNLEPSAGAWWPRV